MAYVEREDTNIVGVYARRQPGRAEEWLADDHPEVVAFINRPDDVDPNLTVLKNAGNWREARDAIVALLS